MKILKKIFKKRKVFEIDGDNFSDLNGFFKEISNQLMSNEKWGEDLNSFRIIIQGGFGKFGYNEKIDFVWNNSYKSKTDLSYTETIRQLREGLKNSYKFNPPRGTIEENIKLAEKNEGITVFDWIMETIGTNENIRLFLR